MTLETDYQQAVAGATPEDTKVAWLTYLAAKRALDGDMTIFHYIRGRARIRGSAVCRLFLAGRSTHAEFHADIRSRCADAYVSDLAEYGLANVDIASNEYRAITAEVAYEGLLLLEDLRDGFTGTEVCTAMCTIWHMFVEAIHAEHRLPTVEELKEVTHIDSDAEQNVIDNVDLTARMDKSDKDRLIALVNA